MSVTQPLWDHLRAILVLVHVVAVVGMSIPSPEGFSKADALENKDIAGPLHVWEQSLSRIGIPTTLTRGVALYTGRSLEIIEDKMERTFYPYAHYLGVRQSWRMFSSSPAKSWMLEIFIEDEGTWTLLYRPFDPQARWQATLWEDGRVRGMINALANTANQASYQSFVKTVAWRAAQDFPQATRLKVQRRTVYFPDPAELRRTGQLKMGPARGVEEVPLRTP